MADESYEEALGRADHIADLEQEEIEDLLEVTQSRTLVPGEPLWSVGEDGDGAYVLVSGRVELTLRVQPDGKQTRQVGTPGSWIALPHLAAEWEHESTAYPIERTEILKLERSDFWELFDQQHPAAFAVADAVAEQLVEEVRDANRRLQEVFGHPAETLRTLRRRARDAGRH